MLTSRRRGRDGDGPGRGLIVALGVIVVVAALAWWGRSWISGGSSTPAPVVVDTTSMDTSTPRMSDAGVQMEPFEDLPPLQESDAWLREEAAALSPDPEWPTWLEADGLVDRVVLGVVNVAAGESPAAQLPFLEPSDTFAVVVEGDRTFADPRNGRRYDALVGSITSLDARAAARFYRGVSPLFEAGLRELGFVDREFDELARSALDVILEAEVPAGPLEVEQQGIVWAYVDPELEGLSPATKHLLRIGPDNLLRLQDWARSFAAASGLSGNPGR
ncbi:MAG: DUF3014 domain-containing protein [Gemmatimonadota bacterium]